MAVIVFFQIVSQDTVLVDDVDAEAALLDADKVVQVQRLGEVVKQPEINT